MRKFTSSGLAILPGCQTPDRRLRRTVLAALCVVIFSILPRAGATDRFWSGGSTNGSDNISDSGNWFSPGKPTGNAGDNLNWNNTTGSHHYSYFDYGDYSIFGSINIYNGAGIGQLYGNALKFTGTLQNFNNTNLWNIYNSNVSVAGNTGTTFYVISNGGGLYFKLDGSSGTGSGDGGSLFLAGKTMEVQGVSVITFQNIIANGSEGTGNITYNNSNTVTLAGSSANTYTGTTAVSQGMLLLNKAANTTAVSGSSLSVASGATVKWGNDNQIGDATTVSLNGGTLNLAGHSERTGALTLQANSSVDLGTGTNSLAFGGSSTRTAGTLSIINWNSNDHVYFYNDTTNTTAYQLDNTFLSNITINGMGVAELSTGEIVPVPEPAAWLAGILTLGTAAYGLRRRTRFAA